MIIFKVYISDNIPFHKAKRYTTYFPCCLCPHTSFLNELGLLVTVWVYFEVIEENHKHCFSYDYLRSSVYIQGVPGENFNILADHSTGHSKKKW